MAGSDVGFGVNTYMKLASNASPERMLAAMPALAPEMFRRGAAGMGNRVHLLRMEQRIYATHEALRLNTDRVLIVRPHADRPSPATSLRGPPRASS